MGQQDHVVHPVSRPRGSDDEPGAERQGDPSAASHRRAAKSTRTVDEETDGGGVHHPAIVARRLSFQEDQFRRGRERGPRSSRSAGPPRGSVPRAVRIRCPRARRSPGARSPRGRVGTPQLGVRAPTGSCPRTSSSTPGPVAVARCWLGAGSEGQVRITLTWIFVRRGLPRGSVSGGSGRRCCRGTGPRSRRAADREASGP